MLNIEKWLGFSIPFQIPFFHPTRDWFDLGILFVMLGLIIVCLMVKFYQYQYSHVKLRLRQEYYTEIRWWYTVYRVLFNSLMFAGVIKLLLIILGLTEA